MPQAPRPLDPNLSERDRFGAALRAWRLRRGLSQAELARPFHVHPDLIAKIEKASRWLSADLAARLDEHLDAAGELVDIWKRADDERARPKIHGPADPAMVEHWHRMLGALAAAGNAIGGSGLIDIVATESGVISRYGDSSSGSDRSGFIAVEARWLEFGSWIADNQGDAGRATSWLKQAGTLAARVGDRVFAAYVLMRRAQRACEQGAPRLSLELIASTSAGDLPPRIAALMAIREAHAHALLGDGRAAQATVRRAAGLLEESDRSDPVDVGIAAHCTPGYVRAHEAQCLLALGESAAAIREYSELLATWPASQRLDEGLFRSNLALAHARLGALDEAAAEGERALALGVETGSRRTLRVVGQLLNEGSLDPPPLEKLREAWTRATAESAS